MQQEQEHEFSFKSLFVPFTTLKAIHWIIFIGIVVYFNSFFNGFIRDDDPQVVNNLFVHSISNIAAFFTGSTFYNGGSTIGVYFKPLLTLYFSTIYSLFGSSAFMFHGVQTLLHIVNTCLLFLIFQQFLKKPLSFILSLVFLIHPINSESVLYISGAQEPLFFFFGITALWITIKFSGLRSIIISTFLLFLSLLSKETAIIFFAIVGFYKYLFKKQQLYLFSSVSGLFILIYIVLRIHAIGLFANSTAAPIDRASLLIRVLNIPSLFFFYLKTFFLPINLSSSYQWVYKNITFDHFFFPFFMDIIFLSLVIFSSIFLYNRKLFRNLSLYIFFTIWFLLGVGFHMQLIPLDITTSERWFYLPLAGILGMIGICIEELKFRVSDKWFIGVVCIVLFLLSIRTFLRSYDWRDDLTLATHDIKISPEAYDINNQLSNQMLSQNKFSQAKFYAQKSVALFPHISNYNNLGLADQAMGDYNGARLAYLHALSYGQYYKTYENLAILGTVDNSNPNSTRAFIQSALTKFPYDATLWLYLAILEYENKNIDVAKSDATKAYSLNQSSSFTYVYTQIMNGQKLNINLSY